MTAIIAFQATLYLMNAYKMPADVIEALREGQPLAGHIGDAELQKFLDARYTKRQSLEVLFGLVSKLISNFTNALAHTKLDDGVEQFA